MKQKALVIANNHLNSLHGKTAHGLIRKCERYDIVGVIDSENAGKSTSDIIEKCRALPIFVSVTEAVEKLDEKPQYCITGVATHGGAIPDDLKAVFVESLEQGISLINGLHEFLTNHAELNDLAQKNNLELIDIRKPREELSFWSGNIYSVKCPIIAILGTDCALGKRTTTQWLLDELRSSGVKAEMVYTGQTGWLQGAKYGFIFDITPNDFVSGELEKAIVECYENEKPEVILLEGQSSLRNPSGPCGAEFLLSANAKGVILQHSPTRKFFEGFEDLELKIPTAKDEVKLINAYGSDVIAISMNTEEIESADVESEKEKLKSSTGRPTFSPVYDGLSPVASEVRQWMGQ